MRSHPRNAGFKTHPYKSRPPSPRLDSYEVGEGSACGGLELVGPLPVFSAVLSQEMHPDPDIREALSEYLLLFCMDGIFFLRGDRNLCR